MKPAAEGAAADTQSQATTDAAAAAAAGTSAPAGRKTEGAVLDELEGLKRRTSTLEHRTGITKPDAGGKDGEDLADDPDEPGEYISDLDRFLYDQPKPPMHHGEPWKTRRGKAKPK